MRGLSRQKKNKLCVSMHSRQRATVGHALLTMDDVHTLFSAKSVPSNGTRCVMCVWCVMYMCMCIYIYIYIHVCVCEQVDLYMYTYMSMYIYVYTYKYIFICIPLCIYIYSVLNNCSRCVMYM